MAPNMNYKSTHVVLAFILFSLISPLHIAGRSVLKLEDAETKEQVHGYNKTGESDESDQSRQPKSSSLVDNSIQLLITSDIRSEDIGHWAIYQTFDGKYYGARAKLNLWDVPSIQAHQRSSTLIWLSNYKGGHNVIAAGFHAHPDLYGDHKLHFYTYWATEGSGCYNLNCRGFVLVNQNILTPGSVVGPTSVYAGQQYYIKLSIRKDPQSGDWLLFREDLSEPRLIGYWPKSLFTTLRENANKISWGGFVSYTKNNTGPPMGSGHFSSELQGKAAFIKNIEISNSVGEFSQLTDGGQFAYNDKGDCYDVTGLVDSGKQGFKDGYLFYFGGPGGCTN